MNRMVFGVGALASFVLFASGAVAASQITVGLAGDLRSMYPAGSTEDSSLTVQQHIYEGLVTWRENGEVAPMLAAELPTVSADRLTYTFKLRDGVKFHDGTPLSAEAVVNSWKFLLDKKTGWSCRQYFNGTNSVNVVDVVVVSPTEVKFVLGTSAPELLSQMARADCGEGGIMAPSVYADGKPGDKPIGTGPFKVDSVQPGQKVLLSRYADYSPRDEPTDGYAGKKEALVDKLTFMVIPDPAAAFAALLAREIDLWAQINTAYADQIKAKTGLVLGNATLPSINTFAFQTAKGPFANRALRQAVNHAVDRNGMVEAVARGYATPSASPIPASSAFYGPTEKSGFEYDLAKAQALLKEAGYKGEKIVITTNKNYSVMYETGVLLQAMLQALGVNAEIEIIDFATQLQKYYSGDYQIMTWNYAPTLDPALLLDRITGSKESQKSKLWDNPKARVLVNDLLRASADKRQPIYDEINKLYLEDAPMLVWSSGQATDAYSARLKGFKTWVGRKVRLWNVGVAQ
jgi:peptide/nickel transport system substrate-binding protein